MKVFVSSAKFGKDKLKKAIEAAGGEVVHSLQDDVNLIIPTVDEELTAFACMRDFLASRGVTVAVSSEYTIQMCRDKAEFYRFCRRHGFDTPITMQQKVIAKPRFGKGSRGQVIMDRGYVLQEFIEAPEYSIDYFKYKNKLSIVPRLRQNVINGESQSGTIVMDEKLIAEARRLGEDLQLEFHAVMQCFYDGQAIKWIEVNPRYGGGSWLTFDQFNSPKELMDLVQEKA